MHLSAGLDSPPVTPKQPSSSTQQPAFATPSNAQPSPATARGPRQATAAYDPTRYGRSAPSSASASASSTSTDPALRGTANSNPTAPRSTATATGTKQLLPVSAQLLGQALGYPLTLGGGGGGGFTLPMPTGSLLESSSLYSAAEGGSMCASPLTALPTPAVVPAHPFKNAGAGRWVSE